MTKNEIRTCVMAALALIALALPLGRAVRAQDVPMKVKGGHELGETADQFFGEGHEKELLSKCASGDFKGLKKPTKHLAKVYCADLTGTRQKAVDGKRVEYKVPGDTKELRKETFTFDHGHLVKVEIAYVEQSAQSNDEGKKFDDILTGVKAAYGPPTGESTKTIQNAYSLNYILHKDVWVAAHAAVIVEEQPAPDASIVVTAYTREEYDESLKTANPLE